MKQLTPQEMDALTGMMIVLFHAGERCSKIIMQQYAAQYKASKDYQLLCKIYGRAKADLMVQEQTEKILTQSDKMNVKRIVKQAEDLQRSIEKMTSIAIQVGDQPNTCDNFDALLNDANNVCKLMGYYANLMTEEDMLKADSAFKALAKGNRVPETIMQQFEMR
jgi:hypothetical protein